MLLSGLFDPELVDKLDAYNKQRDIAISDFKATWKNSAFELEEAHTSLSDQLSLLLAENKVIEIAPTKSALNKVIKWSSSKFNEYKKCEFIETVMEELTRKSPKYTSRHFTSGSYGAGSTGNARSNYGIKGTGGDYEVITYGLNTYIVHGETVISFLSNGEFVSKASLSPSCVEFKRKLAAASKTFDNLWPVKCLDSEFNN